MIKMKNRQEKTLQLWKINALTCYQISRLLKEKQLSLIFDFQDLTIKESRMTHWKWQLTG